MNSSADPYLRGFGRVGPINTFVVSHPARALLPTKGRSCGICNLDRGEGSNRLQWPMGIVHRVYPGRDGLVRTVEVKTANGLLTRPIQRIHDLEMTDSTFESTESPNRVSQYGRKIKLPSRLDL